MYILGAVEIFLMFMTEGAASLFGPIEKEEDKGNLLNNMRLIWIIILSNIITAKRKPTLINDHTNNFLNIWFKEW